MAGNLGAPGGVSGAPTPRDACIMHWLSLMPGHLMMVAKLGSWGAQHDAADCRLGRFGLGHN